MNDRSVDKPLVLIIDDDDFTCTTLSRLLDDEYRTLTSNGGQEAIDLAVSEIPDLILLDVDMPDIDGYELCERLRNLEPTEKIPVIFVTGLEDEGDEEQAFAVGADDYVVKPIKRAVVRSRVRRTIQNNLYIRFLEALLDQKNLSLEALREEARLLLGRS